MQFLPRTTSFPTCANPCHTFCLHNPAIPPLHSFFQPVKAVRAWDAHFTAHQQLPQLINSLSHTVSSEACGPPSRCHRAPLSCRDSSGRQRTRRRRRCAPPASPPTTSRKSGTTTCTSWRWPMARPSASASCLQIWQMVLRRGSGAVPGTGATNDSSSSRVAAASAMPLYSSSPWGLRSTAFSQGMVTQQRYVYLCSVAGRAAPAAGATVVGAAQHWWQRSNGGSTTGERVMQWGQRNSGGSAAAVAAPYHSSTCGAAVAVSTFCLRTAAHGSLWLCCRGGSTLT